MFDIWVIVSDPVVQATLSWLGGGLTILAGALWTVFKSKRKQKASPRPKVVKTASASQGIAAIGDVHFRGRMTFKRGTSTWVLLLGFLGLVFLGVRLLSEIQQLSQSEVQELLRQAALLRDTPQGTLTIVFGEDGIARGYAVNGGDIAQGVGGWNVREDGSLCLRWSERRRALPSGCFGLVEASDGILWRSDGGEMLKFGWLARGVGSGIATVEAPLLEGLWTAEGYECPPGILHVEVVRIDAGRDGAVSATKEVGDDCVGAGETTWRGTLRDDVLEVDWRLGSPTGERIWEAGSIHVLSPQVMISEEFGVANESILFRRLR